MVQLAPAPTSASSASNDHALQSPTHTTSTYATGKSVPGSSSVIQGTWASIAARNIRLEDGLKFEIDSTRADGLIAQLDDDVWT
uniref:Uncharacterized protein n=1 Tax=Kalanchoe fedtschenkoi TaxID=63787 RepID=A0A7N0U6H7_KALFE